MPVENVPQDEPLRGSSFRLVVVGALVSCAILGWLLYGTRHVWSVLERLDRGYALGALGCSFAAYVAIGIALWDVLRVLGHRLGWAEVGGIAFVSTSANYFISSMGASGFALKAHLLRKRKVPFGATVTASVVTTAVMYAVLGAIIAQGLAYSLLRMQGTRIAVLEGVLGVALLGLTAAPVLLLAFHREARGRVIQKVFHWSNMASFRLARREIPREGFDTFERQIDEGLEAIRVSRGAVSRCLAWTCLDWALTMAVLWCAFKAVGVSLSVAHLSTGFAVGMATTLIPLLPGGLGAMEASMAAVFARFGTDWDTALVAVLLYRLAYTVVPGIVSVFLLWGLKMSEPQWVAETVSETLPEEQRLRARARQRRRGEKHG
ncbi:MAG: flippase-like domain-containing protein [Elusimicrobia bacterium]|nr:flippase-like domain-containing protein [Elusimicrobiota bacterium]